MSDNLIIESIATEYKLLTKEEEIKISTDKAEAAKAWIDLLLENRTSLATVFRLIAEKESQNFPMNRIGEDYGKVKPGIVDEKIRACIETAFIHYQANKLENAREWLLEADLALSFYRQVWNDTPRKSREIIKAFEEMCFHQNKLVLHNIRLVMLQANRHFAKARARDDAIMDGTLGLIRAAEKFSHKKKVRFATYAMWWIQQSLNRRHEASSRIITLPSHLHRVLFKYNQVTEALKSEYGRDPTTKEIAEEVNVTEEEIKWLNDVRQTTFSLQHTIKSSDNREIKELQDTIKASTVDFNYNLDAEITNRELAVALQELSDNARKVLELRFVHDVSLTDIAEQLNLSRERIRQIEYTSIAKLKNAKNLQKLVDEL